MVYGVYSQQLHGQDEQERKAILAIRGAIRTVVELPAKTRLFRILSELAEELGIIEADKLAQVELPGIPVKEDKNGLLSVLSGSQYLVNVVALSLAPLEQSIEHC